MQIKEEKGEKARNISKRDEERILKSRADVPKG